MNEATFQEHQQNRFFRIVGQRVNQLPNVLYKFVKRFTRRLEENYASNIKHVTLAMRGPCNYSCYYCVASKLEQEIKLHSMERLRQLYEGFHEDLIITELECGGSEPTLHPQIREILELATEYGVLSMPTNNSLPPQRWIPSSGVERLMVRAALHPQAESELDSFVDRLLFLKDAGADVSAIFVVHPIRVNDVSRYNEFFSSKGIVMSPTPFVGQYEGKKYPDNYTDQEKTVFATQNNNSWYSRLVLDMNIRDFQGIPCLAGATSIFIDESGYLRRCLYDTSRLQRPLKKAAPCQVKECGCGLLLEELNTYDTSFWNFWIRLVRPELLREQTRTQNEIYLKNKAKYFDLMKRYNKKPD
jgi:organic radical activating enzyme